MWWRSLLLTPPTPDQHLSHLHLWRKVIQLRRVSSLFVSGNLMCLFDRFYKLKLSEVEQKLNFKLLCEHAVQPFSRWWRSSLWAQTEGDSVFVQADELQGPVSDTLNLIQPEWIGGVDTCEQTGPCDSELGRNTVSVCWIWSIFLCSSCAQLQSWCELQSFSLVVVLSESRRASGSGSGSDQWVTFVQVTQGRCCQVV